MKRFLITVSLLLCVFVKGFSIDRTWIGGSSGNWGEATNWTPNGIPTASDDLTINSNSSIIIDVSPVLSSLLITGNVTVVFSITNNTGSPLTRIFTPSSTSSITKGFQLDAGSSLTLETNIESSGSGNLSLRFNSGVYGQVNGTLIFNGNLSGTGNPLTTIALNSGANFQVNGTLQFYSASENISGSSPSILFFNSGSSMEIIKNGGSFPDASWHANSLVRALGTGMNAPAFNGTTYGNLEWNCPLQNNYNLAGDITFNNFNLINTKSGVSSFRITNTAASIRTLTINGNLIISANAKFEISGSSVTSGNGGKLHLKGNLTNQGILTTSGATGTINDFELNGTSNQSISSTGTLSGSRLLFIMNNPAGSTLNSPLTLPGNLSLQNGTIKTTSTNVFRMIMNATYSTEPSNISFIDGPMEKMGNEHFTFPVGKGSIYAPITMNSISGEGINDVFTAEYIRGNPQSAIGSGYDASSDFDHISYVEYWRLTQDIGDAVKSVAITVNAVSFCKDLDNTFVSRYQPGTGWVNEGRQVLGTPSASGPYAIATLRIGPANTISEFGYFTLATDQTFAINPLPIKLVSFNSTKISERKALLHWELAECCVADAKFQLERAGSDRRFASISTVKGNETSRFYTVYDNDLKTGVNYYRLKIMDIDGAVTYSRVVAVMNGVKDILLTLSPTIISSQAQLTISSRVPQSLDLFVVDMTGKILRQIHQKIQSGNNTIPLSLSHLHNGAYLIYGVTAEGRTNPIQFIKQ